MFWCSFIVYVECGTFKDVLSASLVYTPESWCGKYFMVAVYDFGIKALGYCLVQDVLLIGNQHVCLHGKAVCFAGLTIRYCS